MDPPSPVPDYSTALAYLYGRINYERTPASSRRSRTLNLDRMRWMLDRLGNPHVKLPVVHVTGTKGKGSTASMISSILTAAGYRTGLYTSPHLERLEERIVVDGQPISSAELVAQVNSVRPIVQELDANGPQAANCSPTFFEITTAMAMNHFSRRNVDIAVLEVGMGGRLDSTNVCHPAVCVITTISFDHTRQLGNTLSAIAFEKAGIVKPGVPVVSGVVPAEPAEVIARVAAERDSPLLRIGQEFTYTYHPPQPESRQPLGTFDYREVGGARQTLDGLQLGLVGRHQAANAAVSLASLGQLRAAGWNVPESAVRAGLATVRCPARIEVLRRHPTIVVDTAHNVASIEALIQTVNESFPEQPRLLVFACSRDKDWSGMLSRLAPHFPHVILTRYVENPRAVPPNELASLVSTMPRQTNGEPQSVSVCPTPAEAWEEAKRRIEPSHFVCITGSFFLAAEMRWRVAASRF